MRKDGYNKATTLSLANKMIYEMITYQLRGRTYCDTESYIKDYNDLFELVKKKTRISN